MKINEAIREIDRLKPNMYCEEDKIKWLSRVEHRIYNDIIQTHEYNEGEPHISFFEYRSSDMERQLIAGSPYDELYIHWLGAQIDYNNKEFDAFNASTAMFESVYTAYRNHYNSTHMPKGTRKNYF